MSRLRLAAAILAFAPLAACSNDSPTDPTGDLTTRRAGRATVDPRRAPLNVWNPQQASSTTSDVTVRRVRIDP